MINNGMSWLSLGSYINPKARNTELSNDYNQLTNRPIITLTGTSQNPIKLWKLDVGLYILNGYVQHTNVLLSEARGLFVSATIGIVDGKYVISAFIPFWEGQYEYILPSLSSETYTEHQMIRMITQGNSLTLDNIREYFPTQDYHPTTKKYVDETMDAIRNELGKMGLSNNDVQSLIKENRRRDIAIQALLSQNSDKMVTINEEVHNISMDYSLDEGIATINTLEGSTLVNVSKDTEYDKILSYEQDIVENTNTVDLEVDGNLNPIIIGDTLVNVCTQNNPTAITNEYTVEGSNHFALQDEVEGNCRPIIQGNTIVNRSKTKDSTPLTTYVSEVEGNEMSLVDDTDTHVRVDKLIGNTLVNLWREENVKTSYRAILENHRIKCTTDTNKYHNFFIDDISMIKPSITYTCIVNIYKNTLNDGVWIFSKNIANNEYDIYTQSNSDGWYIEGGEVGQFKLVFTTPAEIIAKRMFRSFVVNENQTEGQEVELNIILLEGDYTNKPIPQEYFEGLKNSYESEYIPENLMSPREITCNGGTLTVNNNIYRATRSQDSSTCYLRYTITDIISSFKPNTIYTIVIPNLASDGDVARSSLIRLYDRQNEVWLSDCEMVYNGKAILIKTPVDFNPSKLELLFYVPAGGAYIECSNEVMILEGDYTSNPPTYEEVMEHSGKYRCEVEVQGKNLCDNIFEFGNIDLSTGNYNSSTSTIRSVNYIPIKPNTTYILSSNGSINSGGQLTLRFYDSNLNYLPFESDSGIITQKTENNKGYAICNSLNNAYFCKIRVKESSSLLTDIQLEEGDTVTAYEPYHNQTQTVYLNSPLLEGDEVVYKEGKLCHYHKMGKVVLDGSENWNTKQNNDSTMFFQFYWSTTKIKTPENNSTKANLINDYFKIEKSDVNYYINQIAEGLDLNTSLNMGIRILRTKLSTQDVNGFKQWLSENPTTIVYELANPYYETISTSELLLPITTNCKLLTSSNIPLTTMSTRVFTEEVNILANTQYSLNFNSDVASTVNITLGGTVLSNQAIVQGYNKFSITTPSTLVDSLLIIEGSGVNISEVVVTEYDEGVCEYIEGLKSSFEDGWIPSEEDNLVDIPNVYLDNQNQVVHFKDVQNYLSKGKIYTLSYIIGEDTSYMEGALFRLSLDGNIYVPIVSTYKIGRNTISFKMPYDTYCYFEFWNRGKGIINISDIIILEGDWTHLTEEDFNHLGQYKVEYKVVGKNKFKGELINNKHSSQDDVCERVNNQDGSYNIIPQNVIQNYFSGVLNVNVTPNKTYKISYKIDNVLVESSIYVYKGFNNVRNVSMQIARNDGTGIFTVPKGVTQISVGLHYNKLTEPYTISDIQIEEGTVVTEYEPYKESIQTVYLNSPLLEGDTIEEIDGEVYHVHRYDKVVLDGSENWSYNYGGLTSETRPNTIHFHTDCIDGKATWTVNIYCDRFLFGDIFYYDIVGIIVTSQVRSLRISHTSKTLDDFKQWLSENPTTVVYGLTTPTYELIPSSSIVCKSYPNGHLDFDTNVHINNTVNFVKTNLPITYANTSTNYKLQFVSDKDIENVTINALGNIMENVTINKGLNKISFTSPSNATNILTFEGIGYAYISDVQLVATDKDIDYFKGLYSTYECGLIENESNENYGKYEVNIVSYNAPIQFGKGGKIE